MSSLSGVQITTGPTTWTIGPLIGSGACSLGVFSITPSVPSSKPTKKQKSSQSNLRWCVKFAEVVETKGKKKKTDKQRNSDQIFYEYQLYSNALGPGRGIWCPEIPSLLLRPYGELTHSTKTYRYLIMEKIQHDIFHGCGESRNEILERGKEIVRVFKELHGRGVVFVDVKPDNLRLDSKNNVRLIDLGCIERYITASGKHREDIGCGGGTPDYWSRRVSENEGCSVGRVDDVEAVLFCMLEEMEGTLPWSNAKSDAEMARVKSEWGDSQSGVWDYLKSLKYNDPVDYDLVISGLDDLKISGRKGGKKKGKKSPGKKSPVKVKKSEVKKKISPRKKKEEVIEILESSEEEEEEKDDMDVEESEEEEEDPPLYLVFESGPDAGAVWTVGEEACKVQRSKGSPKKTKSKKTKTQTTPTPTTITLNDTEVSTNHATLSVKYSRKKNLILSSSLIIKDLNSSNGTFINGKKLEPKKTRAAFINDSVRFGASVCRIKNHP